MGCSCALNAISMKKLILGLLLSMYCVASFAEKTEDMYIMRHLTSGQLYFISEIIFPSTDSKLVLPFDITYFNTSDSASIKMTIYENTLTDVDSVALLLEDARYVCPTVHSIYKEKEKKLWVHRSDCAFSYHATKLAMIQPTPPQIIVYTAAGEHTYAMTSKNWQKLQPHLQEIFMIIDASRR